MIKKEISFTESALKGFRKIYSEITIDTLEHDFSPRFVEHFVKEVLGYQGNEYKFERGRTDITLLDENKRRIVVIETKRPKEDLNAEKWQTQANKYADSSTLFVGLTNGFRFLIWQINKAGNRELKFDFNIKALIDEKRASEDKLTTQETEQILFLNNLSKEQVWSSEKYSKFDDYYAKIDVADEEGFAKLIEHLNYISDDLLRQYTYSTFDEYYAGYAQYKQTMNDLERLKRENGKNDKTKADLARFELKTEGKYKKYSSFSGFFIWKALSNRPDDREEENKQVFCKESIYVLLNRLLFIRICEDKELLGKKISNGGIERLREQLSEPIIGDTDIFKQIIQFSYGGAKRIYAHFYEKDNPLDWYESGDGELDSVLNKVLWLLNQFNFSKVDRDILGKLYEKYLPKDERKKLGEFYTPDEVIDYILDAVDYTPTKAIDGKDLIDPACGSGGFLVRAARRLIARYAVKFGKATPKEAMNNKQWSGVYEKLSPKECEEIINSVATHIHGFDINPFAVNITEMNLLFQIIDLYSKAAKYNKSFFVPRFKVYETDSLEMPIEQSNLTNFYGVTGKSLAKDKEATDELKNKKYDFVVGNPPYVRQEAVKNKQQLEKDFPEVYGGRADLYVYFIELGVKLLKEKGSLSYITSNKFMKTSYGAGVRSFVLKNTSITQIVDFGDSKLFQDATNYPCIFVLNVPKESDRIISAANITDKAMIKSNEFGEVLSLIRKQRGNIEGVEFVEISQADLSNEKWQLVSEKKSKIINKIKEAGQLLYPFYSKEVIIGMRTGFNEAFIVDSTENFEEELVKKVVTGKDIEPYAIKSTKYCLYPNGYDEKMIPRTIRHLTKFKHALESRAQFKQRKDIKWFEIEQPVSKEKFEKPKIITPSLSEKSSLVYDTEGVYCFNSSTIIIPNDSKREIGYYLSAILNSKLIFFYITSYSPYVQAKYYSFEPQYLKLIPIAEYKETDLKCKRITEISKQLHQYLKKNPNDEEEKIVRDMKGQIDNFVFEIYGITPEERKTIEDAIGGK